MNRLVTAAAAMAVALTLLFSGPTAFADKVTRFAVLVGNNEGLTSNEPLRYAQRDARRMAALLQDIGGVTRENMVLLEGERPGDLRRAFEKIAAKAKKVDGDKVFLFYYSGHADSGKLRMGGSGISLDEIRRRLEEMPTKVRVAIVDACQSGEITRSKGGVVVSPFMEDRPVNVEGLVILTSASAEEQAQESELLQSSYFSHHLMSGLRGPADTTEDGRVSAIEAYEYAYQHTVKQTEGTTVGTQHPTFLYALEGQGDISLTAVGDGRARMVLPAGMDGTVLFYGGGGHIETEVLKSKGSPISVALYPGTYQVRWRSSEALWVAEVVLLDGEARTLGMSDFKKRSLTDGTAKGAPVGIEEPAAGAESQKVPDGERPLTDTPLGGGSNWKPAGDEMPAIGGSSEIGQEEGEGVPPVGGEGETPESGPEVESAARPDEQRPSKAAGVHIGADTGPEGPVYDGSKSFAKRPGARLKPAGSMAVSLVVPGLGHGFDRQYGTAATVTAVFLTGAVISGVLLSSLSDGDSDAVRGVKLGVGGATAMGAFYAYSFGAIDAFYSVSKGGPGAPDLEDLVLDLNAGIAPSLVKTPTRLTGAIGGGLGAGLAIHRNVVLGLRNINFIPGLEVDVATISFAPELRFRGMLRKDLGWSVSGGVIVQIHLEGSLDGDGKKISAGDRDWGLLPYLSGALHYFPARSWSLDFGVRGGVAAGTRRLYGGVAQGQGAFAIEYLGGLTWYI